MSTKTEKKNQQEQPSTAVVPAAQSTALSAPVPVGTAMVSDAAKVFMDQAKGELMTTTHIPLVSIDHKHAGFMLPTGELVPEISGYPIYIYKTRRFYRKPPQPGQKGMPPDCWSGDMLRPHSSSLEQQNQTCAGCPMNEFGTGRDGRSKACGEYTWIFLINKDFGEPPLAVVVAPPSSIRPLWGTRFSQGYFSQARAKHGRSEIVWTTFGLTQMGDQVQYCVLAPHMGPAADVEIAGKLVGIRNQFLQVMDELRMKPVDVAGGGEE